MRIHEAQRIATALESIANSMNNGFSLDDQSSAAMSAYGKVSYAVGELDSDLHRLSVGEIKIRIDRIREKLSKLQNFV
jgi:hypothetical protein|tara:strand:- start:996 stop:1229 length:234 start_codon:yes stop_codon:yes gene_type:complete